jgi:hypothetical protein
VIVDLGELPKGKSGNELMASVDIEELFCKRFVQI